MRKMTLARAAAACGGRLCGTFHENTALGRIMIDSRAVEPGDLFAAYRGERVDGHDYIAAAFERGAACCLAERIPEGETRPILLVENVQRAVEQIAAVLERRLRILKTDKNLNNQIGVPMTVSRIEEEHQAAVVEMGISGFGEMRLLSQIARPTVAVFTIIGHAHLEFLHDRQGVFQAKTEMLENMDEDGIVLVNGDDDLLRALSCRQKLLRFGLGEENEVRAADVRLDERGHISCTIRYGERVLPVQIPAFGQHMIYAALAGAAVGFVLGLTDEEIISGIARYETVGRRSAVTETGKITLIDDCYNANPDSVKCGIDSLMKLPGRHICILGDMLELGEEEEAMHRDVGAYAEEAGAALVLCSGPLGAAIAEGAGSVGKWYPSVDALIGALPELIRPGDRVLVKASRGMRFDPIAEALKCL